MSDGKEPPPLFDNVDIFDKEEENDDLFASATDVRWEILWFITCSILVYAA